MTLTIRPGMRLGPGVSVRVPVLPAPPIVTSGLRLYLDAGKISSYAPQYSATVAELTNSGLDIHIPKVFNANIGNQVSVGYPVVTAWGNHHANVTNISSGTGVFGPDWVFTLDNSVAIGYSSGFNATFGNSSVWTDTVGSMAFSLIENPTYSSANGGSLLFNGNTGQFALSDRTLGTLANWSIEVWHYYNATNAGDGECIFTEDYGGGTINLTLGAVTNPTQLQAAYFGAGFKATDTGIILATNTWNHIVGLYDGAYLKLYINGVLVSSHADAGDAGSAPAANNRGYRLMSRWDPGGFWGGRLSVVRVYDRALSQADVTNNYNAEHTRFGLN